MKRAKTILSRTIITLILITALLVFASCDYNFINSTNTAKESISGTEESKSGVEDNTVKTRPLPEVAGTEIDVNGIVLSHENFNQSSITLFTSYSEMYEATNNIVSRNYDHDTQLLLLLSKYDEDYFTDNALCLWLFYATSSSWNYTIFMASVKEDTLYTYAIDETIHYTANCAIEYWAIALELNKEDVENITQIETYRNCK